MRASDTNLLVRLVVRDDPRQFAAAETFFANGGWVSHLVLVETLWILSATYHLNAESLATIVEMLLSQEAVVLQDADVVKAALQLFRKNPRLGFSDCLILETARKAGHLPLGTVDRNLSKLDGAEQSRDYSSGLSDSSRGEGRPAVRRHVAGQGFEKGDQVIAFLVAQVQRLEQGSA